MENEIEKVLREELANLEHEQWMAWTKYIDDQWDLDACLTDKWKKNWKPYSELTEEEKDKDREWGDKVLEIFKKALTQQKEEMKKEIESINIKNHACRFNDGEQTCECYVEAIEEILKLFNK